MIRAFNYLCTKIAYRPRLRLGYSSSLRLAALCLSFVLFAQLSDSQAHNNPTFREDLLLTITVNAEAPARSSEFSISWPKKTVQLIWRITSTDQPDRVHFELFQNGTIVADKIAHQDQTQRFTGDGFTIKSTSDDQTSFSVELYAKVIDRSKKSSKKKN